ncbi:MAG: nucleotidyltransferase substrate binding protein [Chloroflexi bacterium]|nr:nucleotidyltransferase substrate binding protein [Chloroflexota bacterium]
MNLDLSNLKDSLRSLEKAVHSYHTLSKNNTLSDDDMATVKSGVIHNFEVAYEQCWKFMKRWIEVNINPDSADGVTRRELYRLSAENRLITDVDVWMEFHTSRNLTSHTYSEYNTDITFQSALSFLQPAKDFLERLEARND